MLDRLLHRSVVLNLDGDSYRLRDHHGADPHSTMPLTRPDRTYPPESTRLGADPSGVALDRSGAGPVG